MCTCIMRGGFLLNHHQCVASTWMMRRLPQYAHHTPATGGESLLLLKSIFCVLLFTHIIYAWIMPCSSQLKSVKYWLLHLITTEWLDPLDMSHYERTEPVKQKQWEPRSCLIYLAAINNEACTLSSNISKALFSVLPHTTIFSIQVLSKKNYEMAVLRLCPKLSILRLCPNHTCCSLFVHTKDKTAKTIHIKTCRFIIFNHSLLSPVHTMLTTN